VSFLFFAGSGPYIGMGFLTFSIIIIIEIFGSPFMRNASLVLALFIGTAVSAAVTVSHLHSVLYSGC
jgi:xanthine/uracil permease